MSIEAMKLALEALDNRSSLTKWQTAREALRQAIEQAEKQEPVVWMYQDKSTHEVRFQKHMRSFVDHGATYETPLYTTPQPQREWVGLTDDEINKLWNWVFYSHNEAPQTPTSFAKAVEAKLRSKNT